MEILHKAKRVDNGEWVEGFYCRYQPHASKEEYVYGIIPTYASDMYAIPVNPETICVYTGMKDKNGQKIYENDILYYACINATGTVKWYAGDYIGWCLCDVIDDAQQYDIGMFSECEVVGNEIDNPELLEVE